MVDERNRFNVRLSEDNLFVFLDGVWNDAQAEAFYENVHSEIRRLLPARSVDLNDVNRRIAKAIAKDPQLSDVVLVEGIAPIAPVDGTFTWEGDFFDAAFAVNEATGAIDYRRRQAQPLVEVGQVLARVTPPLDGVPGVDVFGKPIRVRRAEPARIRPGGGVCFDVETRSFFATENGRVRWDGEFLSVDFVYAVEGPVGLETGDIEHSGAVEIGGDVEAGATVVAEGDIEVKGMIEESILQAGGDIIVHCGIAGGAAQRIVAGGEVRARFILEGQVQARGDVIVEREIVHSKVETCGALLMPHGRLVGSDVRAITGVVVRQAGNEGLVPTYITLASPSFIAQEMESRERQVAQLRIEQARVKGELASMTGREAYAGAQHREDAAHLTERQRQIEVALERLEAEIFSIRESSGEGAHVEIIVQDLLFPETVLSIRDVKLRISEPLRGPLRAHLVGDKVRISSAQEEKAEKRRKA